ncbi:MAG: hypothetical protein KA149_11190 [Chitinophagales bacterium]|nr:hypothetical protein [Chitinophagales bacterium]
MASTLLENISTPQSLRNAWAKLNKTNKESKGLSTETIQEFQNALESNILEVSKQLKSGKFRFSKVRGVVIQKKEPGKYRELRIAEIRDRLVLKAIALELDGLLSDEYALDNDCSFAYRKKRNIEDAIRRMVDLYKDGNTIILEADIKNFFGSVNRPKLLQEIFSKLPDESLNGLIREGMDQDVGNLDELGEHQKLFDESLSGIPQGNALSPLMANIYLSSFDKRMTSAGYKMIRYADDFIVMCRSYDEASNALALAKDELESNLGLTIHPISDPHDEKGKTRIADPKYHKFSFLSIRFNGLELWVNEKKLLQLKELVREVTDVTDGQSLLQTLKKTKNLLEGWLAAFKFVNVDRDIDEIDSYINYQLFMSFRKMGFVLNSKHIGNVTINKTKRQGLTPLQRMNSGIPLCRDFLNKMERNQIFI